MQLHLDALGGMAGDMFAAAVLDAFPEMEAPLLDAVAAATARAPVRCRLLAHNDGVLQGSRFLVERIGSVTGRSDGHEHHGHAVTGPSQDHSPAHDHDHAHRRWAEIRDDLQRSHLAEGVRSHAVAIFTHLAEAEARVHGIEVEAVAFHEVGAWDSIADIVAAAFLIDALGADRWSVGALPLGSGRVRTAHGLLPVPAPATTLLLEGFAILDDGVAGERVTPTGAAILRHLCGGALPQRAADRRPHVLGRSGVGFGSRVLPGISNCLRLLAFDESTGLGVPAGGHRELAVIEFEVDDQSAEDLAVGLDRLRAHRDIFDVVQAPVFGKKGRMMTHVRALARPSGIDGAIAACFRETTTIGLRHHLVSGAALARAATTVMVDGGPVRVKTVERPDGRTAKAEADDAMVHATHAARAALRREAERLALSEDGEA